MTTQIELLKEQYDEEFDRLENRVRTLESKITQLEREIDNNDKS